MHPTMTARTITRGSVQQAVGGTAAMTQVALTARPITNMGMPGTRAVGGQRQVLDLGYYTSELRNLITATNKEAEALSKQTMELQKREGQLQRQQESLQAIQREVDELQGELQDILYSQSRLSENATLEDLRAEATEAESAASKTRNEANIAYKARVDAEERLKKNEASAVHLRTEMEAQIESTLGSQAAERYRSLNDENITLKQKESELRKELQEAAAIAANAYSFCTILSNYTSGESISGQSGHIAMDERMSGVDTNIQKAITLHRQIRAAKRELDAYKTKIKAAESHDPEQSLKQQLRNRFRIEQTETQSLIEEIKITEGGVQQRKKLLEEIASDATVTITKEQKDLLKSVIKAEAFLTEFPNKKLALQTSIKQAQAEVVSLISRLPVPQSTIAVPGEETPGAIEAQLQQKSRELDRTTDTEMRVNAELRAYGDKVSALTDSLERLRADLREAESIENVEAEESTLKTKLTSLKAMHEEETKALDKSKSALRLMEDQLAANENAQLLRNLLDQLSANLQKKYAVELFIAQKTIESCYDEPKAKCLQLISEINNVLMGV
ncbi:Intraflagellar transport protein component IFT74/72 [Giardia duodenalis ATCC 50581]|nr:Intraflagellar transport protein component IFT74/72 [Giardia intestinalis ATCC 50581]